MGSMHPYRLPTANADGDGQRVNEQPRCSYRRSTCSSRNNKNGPSNNRDEDEEESGGEEKQGIVNRGKGTEQWRQR